WEVEAALLEIGVPVTVTRRDDATVAPNGYIYNIYFGGDGSGTWDVADVADPGDTGGLNVTWDGCTAFNETAEETVELAVVSQGSADGAIFTSASLPLADVTDAALPARFLGGDGTETLGIYRITGHLYTVSFDSNLGDVAALAGDASALTGEAAAVTVYAPDLRRGQLPERLAAGLLQTGVPYNLRVAAASSVGYGPWSETVAMATPAARPSRPAALSAGQALHRNEVQMVTLGATARDEVQVLRTAAPRVTDVQLVTTTAGETEVVSGTMGLYFPEVQTVTVSATAAISTGSYALVYTSYTAADSSGGDMSLVASNETTACMDWDATAAEVEAMLEELDSVDGVFVVRSGDASDSSDYGYEYEIRFTGRDVSGDVQPLRLANDGYCSGFTVAGAGEAAVTIETTSAAGAALGTGTAIQAVRLLSAAALTTDVGAFRLALNVSGDIRSTGCVSWDASAAVVEAALENLETVDGVHVEVTASLDGGSDVGAGGSGDYGRTWIVFFDGNALRDEPLSEAMTVNATGCSNLSTTVDGVVMSLDNATFSYELGIEVVRKGGLKLAADAAAADVRRELLLLPAIVEPLIAYEGAADEQGGRSWTMSFAGNPGDVAEMVCMTESGFVGACGVVTLVQGNSISGNFYLNDSETLASDATADDVAAVLEATGLGTVLVTRSDNDGRGGFTWSITFEAYSGDVPTLVAYSALTGYDVTVDVTEGVKGNQLGGTFALGLSGYITEDIPFDASKDDVAAALMALDNVGLVWVERAAQGTEGGATYLITFADVTNPGDVPALEAYTGGLTGDGAAAVVMEAKKGSEAVGTAVKLSFDAPEGCAASAVELGVCGAPVLYYQVDWDPSDSFASAGYKTARVDDAELLLRRQRVTTTASSAMSGTFRLSLGGETTSPINAGATAAQLRARLEALSTTDTIAVSRDYSVELATTADVNVTYGALTATCSGAGTAIFAADGGACGVMGLTACARLRLAGEWYRVRDSFDATAGSAVGVIPLAEPSDCAIPKSYQSASATGLALYTWANGYEWSVTFLKQAGPLQLLSSPLPDLYPRDSAAVEVRGAECDGCYYLPALTLGVEYNVRVSACNAYGCSPTGSGAGDGGDGGDDAGGDGVVSVVANQVPFAPEDVAVSVVSGSKVEVFFCEPAVNAGDIWGFRVQWDTVVSFANATANDGSASCGSDGFGSCIVQGSAITGECPHSLVVDGLMAEVLYYFRVSALGDVDPQAVDPSGVPPDNTNWSGTLSARPSDQNPGMSGAVMLYVLNGSTLKVHVVAPDEDGGQPIEAYIFEADVSSGFRSSSYVSRTADVSELASLYKNGPLVYALTGLTVGVPYYVRVAAQSVVGTGAA
ncbi:unnamed protein product, partial [Phaeothamnion confervicola]